MAALISALTHGLRHCVYTILLGEANLFRVLTLIDNVIDHIDNIINIVSIRKTTQVYREMIVIAISVKTAKVSDDEITLAGG